MKIYLILLNGKPLSETFTYLYEAEQFIRETWGKVTPKNVKIDEYEFIKVSESQKKFE